MRSGRMYMEPLPRGGTQSMLAATVSITALMKNSCGSVTPPPPALKSATLSSPPIATTASRRGSGRQTTARRRRPSERRYARKDAARSPPRDRRRLVIRGRQSAPRHQLGSGRRRSIRSVPRSAEDAIAIRNRFACAYRFLKGLTSGIGSRHMRSAPALMRFAFCDTRAGGPIA
eukprot:1195134-Prorocentrum_minimum.AAC.7